MKIDTLTTMIYLTVEREICPYIPCLLVALRNFSVRNFHVMSLSRCEFRKKISGF
jgi:hypothetical protein